MRHGIFAQSPSSPRRHLYRRPPFHSQLRLSAILSASCLSPQACRRLRIQIVSCTHLHILLQCQCEVQVCSFFTAASISLASADPPNNFTSQYGSYTPHLYQYLVKQRCRETFEFAVHSLGALCAGLPLNAVSI